jgi:hypothetical protein
MVTGAKRASRSLRVDRSVMMLLAFCAHRTGRLPLRGREEPGSG